MDDGILVVESWLMSATEYIAIDNTPLRPGVHVDGRSGMARPDQSAGHAKLESKQPLFCLYFVTNKHCYTPFVFVALGAVARVNQVISIFCLSISTMYPWHDCLEVIRSSMSPSRTRWWVGAWLMNSKTL